MQNMVPILFLQPALSLAIATGAILYWRHSRSFRGVALLLGAGAYFIAIAAKEVLNLTAYVSLVSIFGEQSVPVAVLLGLETVLLEVGLAYLFAAYGKKRGLARSDAVPYGLGLAFWENGVLLGALTLFGYVVLYLILLTPSTIASAVYQQLQSNSPALFLPPGSLLPSVLLGALERVSSELAHIAWGVLVVLSAVTGRKRYLAFALPMGLIDALVPFGSYNIDLFETVVFLLSVGFLGIAAWSYASERKAVSQREANLPQPAQS